MSLSQAKQLYLFQAATTDSTSVSINTFGYDAAVQVEVVETAGGTCTLQFNGSFDGKNWYVVGHQRVDNQASPSRSVTAVSVTASLKAVYQLLDPYPLYQAVITNSSSQTVNVRLYAVA